MGFARSVKSPQRLMRVLSLKVTGTGTAALSGTCASNVTLVDNGTGDYTLTFGEAFAFAPEVVVTTVTAATVARVVAPSTTAVQITTFNMSSVATDAVFHVMILGSDAQDLI